MLDVRSLGAMMFTPDPLVESWRDLRRTSRHLELELTHAMRTGDPPAIEDNDAVPGCGCPTCQTLAVKGTHEDARIAEEIVHRLAQRIPEARRWAAEAAIREWAELGVTLPAPGILVLLAERVPGARHVDRFRHVAPELTQLPLEEARALDILEVCRRLGLDEPVRRGREHVVRCPLHDDEDPSLRIDVGRGLWYCDPCGQGGDAIRLWELATGAGFREAVLALAGLA